MKKEVVTTLAHLLTNMKESTDRLEAGLKNNDNGEILGAKREILKIQAKIKEIL